MAATRLIDFDPDHLKLLDVQERQIGADATVRLSRSTWDMILKSGQAYTIVSENAIIACTGMVKSWHGRATAWALLDCKAGASLLGVTRIIKNILDDQQQNDEYTRIETTVQNDWPQAHRWAKLLGFKCEGVMRRFGADGKDHALYARIGNV